MIRLVPTSAVSIALALSLAVTPLLPTRAYAQEAKDEAALTVQPGKLGGNLVELDGKTPIKGATVQLLDKDGKVVVAGATDEKGTFSLGQPNQGSYTLTVGQATGKLVVKEGAQATSLKFVMENAIALGQKKDVKAGAIKLAGISTTGVVMVAVVATVVGLGAGLGIGYGVWGTQSKKKVFVPFSP